MRRFIAFLSAGIIALTCTSCMKKTVETEHTVDVPPKMVFLGDSIPAGYGLEGYTSQDNYHCMSYSNILENKYSKELPRECEPEMVNVAVTGDTSAELLEHLENGEFDGDLRGSDAVVISIGGNDILEIFLDFISDDLGIKEGGASDWLNGDVSLFSALDALGDLGDKLDTALADYEPNLKSIVSHIKDKTDGEIFVQTLYNPFEYYDKLSFLVDFSNEKIGRINQVIEDNAVTEGIENYTIIDVAQEFTGKCGDLTTIKDFDIHPNAEGHKVIADTVDRSLRTKNYNYSTYDEVTDTAGILLLVGVSAAGAVIIALVIAAIVRNSKKSGEDK